MQRRLLSRMREYSLQGLPLEWQLRSGLTLQVQCQADWILYSEIFVDAEYDPAIAGMLARTDEARTLNILDLGANVGFFALRLVDLLMNAGRRNVALLLVEGAPENVATLQRRIAASPEIGQRTRIVHGLAGARSGSATIYAHRFHSASSVINPVMEKHGHGHKVDWIDLDALTADMPTIDLLKCDIEGSEALFLETYPDLIRKVQAAVLELHPQLCDVPACRARLHEAGLTRTTVLREAPDQSVELFERPD